MVSLFVNVEIMVVAASPACGRRREDQAGERSERRNPPGAQRRVDRMNDRTSAVALARRYWVRVDSHVRLVVVSGLSNEDLILLNRVDQSMLICDAP